MQTDVLLENFRFFKNSHFYEHLSLLATNRFFAISTLNDLNNGAKVIPSSPVYFIKVVLK